MPIVFNSPGAGAAPMDFFSSTNIIIGIIFLIAIFFLLREFFCWYWKINKIVNLLEDIKNNTSAKKNIPLIQSIKTEQRIAPNQALAQEAIIKKGYLRGFFSKGNKKNQIIIELLVFGLIIVILYILLRGVFKVI